MNLGKLLCILLLCSTAQARVVSSSHSDQFVDDIRKYPKRNVGGYVYNLSVSTNGWQKLRATFVRQSPAVMGWVATATINGRTTTFVLKNAPVEVYRQYAAIKADYDRLFAEYKAAANEYRQSHADFLDAVADQKDAEATTTERSWVREQKRQRAIDQSASAAKQASSADDSSWSRTEALKNRLEAFDTKGFDLTGGFHFIVYAIRVKQTVEGLPAYDRGIIR